MPFAVSPDDASPRAAIRRAAEELLSGAVARAAAGAERGSPVHDIRKRIKKARALIRLVRPGFDAYARENAALRDAGRMISAARDAEVMAATLADLATRAAPDAQAALRRAAAVLPAPAAAAALPPDLAPALALIRDRARGWRIAGKGFDVLAPGLTATLHAAARAGARAVSRAAGDDLHDEAVHDWRKRVKDHWYHARFLQPIWPQGMAVPVVAAGTLGEDLGLAQDLAVLSRHIAAAPLAPGDRDVVLGLAARRRARLIDRARRQHALLFAEPPEAVAARWAAWWAVWRDG
jgi:CHAD domain-containing protein